MQYSKRKRNHSQGPNLDISHHQLKDQTWWGATNTFNKSWDASASFLTWVFHCLVLEESLYLKAKTPYQLKRKVVSEPQVTGRFLVTNNHCLGTSPLLAQTNHDNYSNKRDGLLPTFSSPHIKSFLQYTIHTPHDKTNIQKRPAPKPLYHPSRKSILENHSKGPKTRLLLTFGKSVTPFCKNQAEVKAAPTQGFFYRKLTVY